MVEDRRLPEPGTSLRALADPHHTALRAVADSLTAQGFDITGPLWGRISHAHLTNVRGALCELDFTGSETMIWHYQPFYGTPASPEQIAGMVVSILGVGADAVTSFAAERACDSGFKGAVGRALTARGMAARLEVIYEDEVNDDIYAVVEVTHPGMPRLGKVQVSDTAGIRWECPLADVGAGNLGLAPVDFAQRIAVALAERSI